MKKRKDVYTTDQIAKLCQVEISTVIHWIKEGKLKAFKTPGGHRRVFKKDLIEFLNKYKLPFEVKINKFLNNVLLVDNDEANIIILEKFFKEFDPKIKIHIAKDGYEACLKAGIIKPDLMILEVKIPDSDSFEVAKNIIKDPRTRDIVIFAMSASLNEREIKEILNIGAEEFLFKPIDLSILKDKIYKYFENIGK